MSNFIPSLSMLRTFAAVSRHGSFTKAAEELNLTQAAISYQMRELESQLGARLFTRSSRAVILTETGRGFLDDIIEPLQALEQATSKLRRKTRGVETFRLLAMQSFASFWLLPRLPLFSALHPRIDVSVVSQIGGVERIAEIDFDTHGLDAAVIYASDPSSWRGIVADRLMDDVAVPVCSPDTLKKFGPIRHPTDLCHHTILHALNWPTIWSRWRKHNNVDVEPAAEVHLQNTGLTMQAAIGGMGVAMAHGLLAREEIRAGRLVAPFETGLPVEEGYYLACRTSEAETQPVLTFRQWIRHEMERADALGSDGRGQG